MSNDFVAGPSMISRPEPPIDTAELIRNMHSPMSMEKERERALRVGIETAANKASWRGDVRVVRFGSLVVGGCFNLIDDMSNPNVLKLTGQYRIIALVAAPEGYTAVEAVGGEAAPGQLPIVHLSEVIKHKVNVFEGQAEVIS